MRANSTSAILKRFWNGLREFMRLLYSEPPGS
jgi:hypothetical protein